MKRIVENEEQTVPLFVNKAFFEEIVNVMPSVVASIDNFNIEHLLRIVGETAEKHPFAVIPKQTATAPQKKRSQAEKVGKFRYLNRKIDKLREDQKTLMGYVKNIMLSLSPFLDIEKDTISRTVCADEVDEALLEHLSHSPDGITPTEAIWSDELRPYGLKPYQITRRVQRMNKRLKETLNRDLAVSIDRRWKLSLFARKKLGPETDE